MITKQDRYENEWLELTETNREVILNFTKLQSDDEAMDEIGAYLAKLYEIDAILWATYYIFVEDLEGTLTFVKGI